MTQFKQRFTQNSGIVSLMEDLGDALNESPDTIMMGGGNPAVIPEVQACMADHLTTISHDPQLMQKLLGEYQPPQGSPECLQALADYFSRQCAWDVCSDNIAISNGAQSAFFTLFNILAGPADTEINSETKNKKILLPLMPDYLGYADLGLEEEQFEGIKPRIEIRADNQFKYHIDFSSIPLADDYAAVCLSRPTNPSGNVVSDHELEQLSAFCEKNSLPLIIDAAYGQPFPGVTFVPNQLHWQPGRIIVMSLSKLGMPGARTGIVVADADIIEQFSRATAALSLAPGNLGPSLVTCLLNAGDIDRLARHYIHPYYEQKKSRALEYCLQKAQGTSVKIHEAEGAFFLWLWFEGLPIGSQEFYERLKDKGVLVVSGHHFFQALDDPEWAHQYECLRVSYCQPWDKVQQGLDSIFAELDLLFATGQ